MLKNRNNCCNCNGKSAITSTKCSKQLTAALNFCIENLFYAVEKRIVNELDLQEFQQKRNYKHEVLKAVMHAACNFCIKNLFYAVEKRIVNELDLQEFQQKCNFKHEVLDASMQLVISVSKMCSRK